MRERPAETQTLVVIGNGMASWKLCQRLVEHGAHESIRIVVFGEEPRPAYDRVHLINLLAGAPEESLVLAPKQWYQEHGIELFLDDRVVEINREGSWVRSESGEVVEYNRLVFATGSYPFVPQIEGVDLPGVFLYREIDDAYDIEEYSKGATSAAVIGGGILGLEAAKALFDLGLKVHVIEHGPGLMHRQIDLKGADLLKQKIEALGVKVSVNKEVVRITPAGVADPEDPNAADRLALHCAESKPMVTDMVLISAGIRPRGELAQAAGLKCAPNGGIMVDDRLQTSDEQIYAIGECAAHRGTTYGLVLPGYQMVDVLVNNLLGGNAIFEGGDRSAKLKVMGITVAALGEYDGDSKALTSALRYPSPPDPNIKVYRKLVTRNGRLIGAVTVGDWDNLERIRDALRAPVPMGFWDMRRFRATGNLWPRDESLKVSDWAEDALVCGCMQVTRGTLSHALADGCTSVADLGRKTNAGSMCGSCKPLLEELLGVDDGPKLPMAITIGFGKVGNVTVQELGSAAKRDAAPRSRRGGDRGALAPPSVRGAPQLPPPSVRGGSGPASVRSGSKELRGPRSNASAALGQVDRSTGAPSTRGSPSTKRTSATGSRRTKRSLPIAAGAPKTQRSSVPPPSDAPRARRSSMPPPPSASAGMSDAPSSQPPAARGSRPPGRISQPPPARRSTPPPMMFSAMQVAADIEEQGPVSVRRPSVGLQSRKVQRIEPRTERRAENPPLEALPPPPATVEPPKPRQSSIPPALEIAPDPTLIDLGEEPVKAAAGFDKIARFALPELEKLVASSRPPPPLEEPEDAYAQLAAESDAAKAALRPSGTPPLEPEPESEPMSEEEPPTSSQQGEWSEDDEDDEDEEYDDDDYETEPGVVMPDRAASAARRSWVPPARLSQPPAANPVRSSRPTILATDRGLMPLFVASIVGFVLSAVLFVGPILAERFLSNRSRLAMLGDDQILKQVTGYGMVGLLLVSLLLSLRKRWKRFAVSDVSIWRMIHGIVAASTLLLLVAHTGLQLGKRMVFVLAVDFLAAAAVGAVAGAIAALSPQWTPVVARNRRLYSSQAHLLVCWPLPVLIILHVVQVYFY